MRIRIFMDPHCFGSLNPVSGEKKLDPDPYLDQPMRMIHNTRNKPVWGYFHVSLFCFWCRSNGDCTDCRCEDFCQLIQEAGAEEDEDRRLLPSSQLIR
jgi:hypothetical protein